MLPCDQTSKQSRLPLRCATGTLRSGGLFRRRSLNGTFVPALSSMFIVERRLWIRFRKTVGAQQDGFGKEEWP
jgi:hypothetical protein